MDVEGPTADKQVTYKTVGETELKLHVFTPSSHKLSDRRAAIEPSLLIWDDKPAEKWDVAYPVGNGRLGAMPFGDFPSEKILLNEETIWARSDGFEMPADSFEHLERLRELEGAGDYEGADVYFQQHLRRTM